MSLGHVLNGGTDVVLRVHKLNIWRCYILKGSNKFLKLKPDSRESGLCNSCPHCISNMCDTSRPCGQVIACRSQARAMIVGRYPSGRVRQTPLKRLPAKRGVSKPMLWKKTRERMKAMGDACGCVWIQFLTDSQQVSVRRFLRSGKMTAHHIEGVVIRGVPAMFISRKELDENFESWEARYE